MYGKNTSAIIPIQTQTWIIVGNIITGFNGLGDMLSHISTH